MTTDRRRLELKHGAYRTYTTYGCRCSLCVTRWNDNQRRLRAKNPAKYREYSKRWEESNHLKARESVVLWIGRNKQWHAFTRQLWKHGLTLDQYHAIAERQDFCCAICGEELAESPDIDHCHNSKRVRGLLCMNCNLGLGHFKDNSAHLVSATRYLARNSA